jgi:hypothetical protein
MLPKLLAHNASNGRERCSFTTAATKVKAMMEKIRVEEIKPIRLCGQVSFDWLLAFHFLHPN